MKKTVILISILVAAAALSWAAWFYHKNFSGSGPAFQPPPQDIARLLETTPPPSPAALQPHLALTAPLKLPPGFTISIFAKNLGNPRVLCLDPDGNLLVSLTHQGKVVALPDRQGRGVASEVVTVLRGPQSAPRPGLRARDRAEALRGRNHGSGDL